MVMVQTTKDRAQKARGHVDACLLQPRPPAPVMRRRIAGAGAEAEDVEGAEGLERPRVELVRLAALPEAEHAAAPAQYAGAGHVLHHLEMPLPWSKEECMGKVQHETC